MNITRKIIITDTNIITDLSNANILDKVVNLDNIYIVDMIQHDEVNSYTGNINVINNNSFPNISKLYYVGNGVTVIPDKDVQETIDSKEVHSYNLKINNPTDEIQVVKLGIRNGYIGSIVEVEGIEIK